MPGKHRAAVRSPRRWLITAMVVGLVAALVGPVGAAAEEGYQYKISDDGTYAATTLNDVGDTTAFRQSGESSMDATVHSDGTTWTIEGTITDGDTGDYVVAVGIAGQCAPSNTPVGYFTISPDPGTKAFSGSIAEASLPNGYNFIRIYDAGTQCQTNWSSAIPTDPMAMITSPDADSINMGTVDLAVTYYDNDYDPVLWAVRYDTCDANTNTVAGNVDGFNTPFMWNGKAFSSSVDLDAGYYCFVFNTQAQSGDDGVRETRWFYVADAEVAGGGQIRADSGDPKDPYKVSFGGELYRVGASQLLCEWTIQFHNVSDDAFDKATFVADSCTDLNTFPLGGADGVVNFLATGTLDGAPGYDVRVRAEDAGEPGSMDTIRFELSGPTGAYDTFGSGDFPGQSNNSGTARTFLDKGNLQISY